MKAVILAGGSGTRLGEETAVMPKPMVRIGNYPILWHIMKCYSFWGFNEFIITLGYKGEVIKNYFLNYCDLAGDLTVDLGRNTVTRLRRPQEDWIVHLVDTGTDTLTGGRVKRIEHLIGEETFMLTYGDGVADVDLNKLIAYHRANKRLATITAVRPPARFGGVSFDGDEAVGFGEKKQINEGWINGGFMVLEPGIFRYLVNDTDVLETDLLERLVRDRQFGAYRHTGFWQCMDTLRDRHVLERLWQAGDPPWKLWDN